MYPTRLFCAIGETILQRICLSLK